MPTPFRILVLLCVFGIGAALWVACEPRKPQPCLMGQKADKCE